MSSLSRSTRSMRVFTDRVVERHQRNPLFRGRSCHRNRCRAARTQTRQGIPVPSPTSSSSPGCSPSAALMPTSGTVPLRELGMLPGVQNREPGDACHQLGFEQKIRRLRVRSAAPMESAHWPKLAPPSRITARDAPQSGRIGGGFSRHVPAGARSFALQNVEVDAGRAAQSTGIVPARLGAAFFASRSTSGFANVAGESLGVMSP